MKKLFTTQFLMAAFVAIALIGCSDDDDNGSDSLPSFSEGVGEGTVLIDGTTIDLTSIEVEDFGSFGGVTNFDITIEDASGDTEVYFELWTDNSDALQSGSYSYDETAANEIFTYGYVETNSNFIVADDSNDTVEIIKDGDTYSFTFNITDDQGNTATGTFVGNPR